MSEEIRRKSRWRCIYNVYEVSSCKNQQCGQSQTRNNNEGNIKGKNKPRKKNVECHYCPKEGYFKKYCYALKIKEKKNIKAKELINIRNNPAK